MVQTGQINREQTGQKDDPALTARARAKELEKKENLTLAEKLILATTERKMKWNWEGVEIENYIPSENEINEIINIQQRFQNVDPSKTAAETEAEIFESKQRLCQLVSGYIIDNTNSITPDFLMSGDIGTSFMLSFVSAVFNYETNTVKEVEVIKGFRKLKAR